MPTHRRTFPGLPEEVSRARHWIREILGGHPCTQDAELIVTELSANAITHTDSAGAAFRIAVTCTGDTVKIAVADAGGTHRRPHIEHQDNSSPRGRGLFLVFACASTVDIRGDHHGHTVIAELTGKPIGTRPC